MNSLLATNLAQQLPNYFFLNKTSASTVSLPSYEISVRDRFTASLPSATPSQNEVFCMNVTTPKPSELDLQKSSLSSNLDQMQSSVLFSTASMPYDESNPMTLFSTAALREAPVSHKDVSSLTVSVDMERDDLTTMRRQNTKLLNRCKRSFVRFWRAPNHRNAAASRRLPAHCKPCDAIPKLPVTETASVCHCPGESVLRDLQNKFSTVTTELHNIQTRLTELQQTCTSIHSALFSLRQPQSSCVPFGSLVHTTAPASSTSVCTLTTTTTTTSCDAPATTVVIPTATTESSSLYPQSVSRNSPFSMLRSKLTPMSVHTGPFDPVDTGSLHEPQSKPETSVVHSAVTQHIPASIPASVRSPLFTDCASSISHPTTTADLTCEELVSVPSLNMSHKNKLMLQSVHSSKTATPVDPPTASDDPDSIPTAPPPIPITTTVSTDNDTSTVIGPEKDAVPESNPNEAFDTFELVQHIRQLMEFHGVSQRHLARSLPNCNQRFLCELLCKPKPWSMLNDRRRQVYYQLKSWFANPDNLVKCNLVNKRCMLLYTVDETTKSEASTTPCPSAIATALSALESTYGAASTTSSCSYSPAPSEPSLEPRTRNKRRRRSTSSVASLSNCSNADAGSLFGGSSSPGLMLDELHKPSADGAVQTEKRIADILSAARMAMALEQCEKKRATDAVHLTQAKTDGDLLAGINKAEVADVIPVSSGNDHIVASTNAPSGLPPTTTEALNGCMTDEIDSTSTGIANATTVIDSNTPPTSVPISTTVPLPQSGVISFVPNSIPGPNYVTPPSSMPSTTTTTGCAAAVPIMLAPLGAQAPTLGGKMSDWFQFLLTQPYNGMNPIQFTVPGSNPCTALPSAVTPGSSSVYLSPSCPTVPIQPTVIMSSASSSLLGSYAPTYTGSAVPPTPLGMAPLVVSPMPMNPLEPLGQNLFFLAPPVATNPQIVSSSDGSAVAVSVAKNKTRCVPGVNSRPRTECQTSGITVTSQTSTVTVPLVAPAKTSTKPEDLPVTTPPADTSPASSSDISELCATDSAGRKLVITYKRPSTDEVIEVTKTLNDLDTDALRTKVKDVLRQNYISQRVFGEVFLGMCQASVSDMLTKPRAWNQLTEKARLPYVRMYMWLNQLNQMGLSYQTPDKTNGTSSPGDSEVAPRDNLESAAADSRKRECSDPSGASPFGTPTKFMKLESVCAPVSDELSTQAVPEPTLTASDRESLFDIAKAAAMAMQRAGSCGQNPHSKARGYGNQTSGPATPTKRSAKAPPQPLTTMQLNGSDGERDPITADSSPLKQSPGRNRVVFSPEQKQALVAEFARQPYPSSDSLRALARKLNLPLKPVVNWFHNRRMRSRQRFPATMVAQDDATENIIDDLTTSVLCPELPGRECNEDFSTGPAVVSMAPSTATQASRRKRPDPTRLIAQSVTNAPTSDESDLIEALLTNSTSSAV